MNKALSMEDIKNIFDGKIQCLTYEDACNKAKRIEDLLYPHNNCIILYIFEGRNNGHYVALKKHNNKIIFFDSYGRTDKQILDGIDDDIRMINDEEYPYITQLLKKYNGKVTINKKVLQDNKSSVCGRWCSFILRNIDMFNSLNELLSHYDFSDNTKENDKKILKLTSFYL